MSQRDLARALHEARPIAPSELRQRVRLIAAQSAEPPRRRVTWRRALVVAIPVAAAVIAAGVLGTRSTHPQQHQVLETLAPSELKRSPVAGKAADALATA